MAGAKTAKKNTRTSAAASKAPANQGDAKLILPCNGGLNAYVRDIAGGKNPNLRTDSDAFVEAIRTLTGAGMGAKVRAELEALATAHPGHGWGGTLARVEAAGAFA